MKVNVLVHYTREESSLGYSKASADANELWIATVMPIIRRVWRVTMKS